MFLASLPKSEANYRAHVSRKTFVRPFYFTIYFS
jgi:hypothetical protein